MFRELGEASIGVVIRDYKGMVLASMSERIILPPSVANLEALVVVRALNFAHEIGFPKIILGGFRSGNQSFEKGRRVFCFFWSPYCRS